MPRNDTERVPREDERKASSTMASEEIVTSEETKHR